MAALSMEGSRQVGREIAYTRRCSPAMSRERVREIRRAISVAPASACGLRPWSWRKEARHCPGDGPPAPTTGVGKVGLSVMPCTTPVAYARMASMFPGSASTARLLAVLLDVWTM